MAPSVWALQIRRETYTVSGRKCVGSGFLDDFTVPVYLSATLPGNGSLKLEGKSGPINPPDTSFTPVQAHVAVKHSILLPRDSRLRLQELAAWLASTEI